MTSEKEGKTKSKYDVIVLGGGAAGLMSALTAGQQGKRVLVIEVSNKLGKKILMSGGGKCNFTNLDIQASNFICDNPHFVKSALSQYTQWDFIDVVKKHNISYTEKSHGQLFCDRSAGDILKMLTSECDAVGVEVLLNGEIDEVILPLASQAEEDTERSIRVSGNVGGFRCRNLVVATGGLSIPTLGGATGYGYELARQSGLSVSNVDASLVPMTLTGKWHDLSHALSGVAVPVVVSVNANAFRESMLFTHRGLSGPSILQLSNYWHLGEKISIDLMPSTSCEEMLLNLKSTNARKTISSALSEGLPRSLVQALTPYWWPEYENTPIQEIRNSTLSRIAEQVHNWELVPSGTEGYRTAEVTRGGVDVDQISSKTMEVKHIPGLFFVGEALGVTGHLGGYNFQWAWSSGFVAGMNVS
ncbi:MAG: aminoacetone oxidase family FAD-binding enzyme [Gammaproteobacteria bacterium]|nr:aminoacetone oxidase family FAD-binding enzyme [Gammaproteobacteria bacterium]